MYGFQFNFANLSNSINYYIHAFLDVNANGRYDSTTEPYGVTSRWDWDEQQQMSIQVPEPIDWTWAYTDYNSRSLPVDERRFKEPARYVPPSYVKISEPQPEQLVSGDVWVNAEAFDNSGIDRMVAYLDGTNLLRYIRRMMIIVISGLTATLPGLREAIR